MSLRRRNLSDNEIMRQLFSIDNDDSDSSDSEVGENVHLSGEEAETDLENGENVEMGETSFLPTYVEDEENAGMVESSFLLSNLEGTSFPSDAAAVRDEVMLRGDDEITWSTTPNNNVINVNKSFKGDAGPAHDLPSGSSSLSYLKLLFTDKMCEMIRINTNNYAEFCAAAKGMDDRNWMPIQSIDEVWAFICVLLVMSIVWMPTLKDYWSNNLILGNNFVKKLMTRQRFMKILQYFHVSERSQET